MIEKNTEGICTRERRKGPPGAHEAIRVINPAKTELPKEGDAAKLYRLIWKRSVGAVMCPAKFYRINISLKLKNSGIEFKGHIDEAIDVGYLALMDPNVKAKTPAQILKKAESLKADFGGQVMLRGGTETAPRRFTEATLIQEMDRTGVGRPSTYASIVRKLQDSMMMTKRHVDPEREECRDMKLDLGTGKVTPHNRSQDCLTRVEQRSALTPTEIGLHVIAFMQEKFPYVVEANFTAVMESDLDQIASGEREWRKTLKTFVEKFMQDIESVEVLPRKIKIELPQLKFSDGTIARMARFGPVLQRQNGTFVDLRGYLRQAKKNYDELTEEEAKMVSEVASGSIKTLSYGRFGMYRKNKNKKKR